MSGNNTRLTSLDDRILDWTHDLLATHTVREYEYMIGKWKDHINEVVDAEKLALEEHEKVLKGVLNAMQQKEQEGAMLAILALSLLTGPALSWIGGTIQYFLYPARASQRNHKASIVYLQNRKGKGQIYTMTHGENEHNKVVAKMYGDAAVNAGQQIGLGYLNGIVGKVEPRSPGKSYKELVAISQIPGNTPSEKLGESLRTKLERALNDEKERTTKTISDFAMQARRNPQVSEAILREFHRTHPNITQMNGTAAREAADRFAEGLVDHLRQRWAKEWMYYGNLPPQTTITEMARKIEREIWAMWIVDQEFKVITHKPKSRYTSKEDLEYDTGMIIANTPPKIEGRSKIVFHQSMVDRLISLGVVLPQSVYEVMELHGRNATNVEKENPTVSISGNVDSISELTDLENWANNRKPELLSGMFDRRPRNIGSIRDVHKILK